MLGNCTETLNVKVIQTSNLTASIISFEKHHSYLRNAAGCGWDADKRELSQNLVVLGHLALALKHLDLDLSRESSNKMNSGILMID